MHRFLTMSCTYLPLYHVIYSIFFFNIAYYIFIIYVFKNITPYYSIIMLLLFVAN